MDSDENVCFSAHGLSIYHRTFTRKKFVYSSILNKTGLRLLEMFISLNQEKLFSGRTLEYMYTIGPDSDVFHSAATVVV